MTDIKTEKTFIDECGVEFSEDKTILIKAPKRIKEYHIPNTVKIIAEEAFAECKSLRSITIPNSVTSIKSAAFYECKKIETIVIPDSVTEIGEGQLIKKGVFQHCHSLHSLILPESIKTLGYKGVYGYVPKIV